MYFTLVARFHCPKTDPNDPEKKCTFDTNFRHEMIKHASKVHGAIYTKQTVSEVNYKRRSKIHSTVQ